MIPRLRARAPRYLVAHLPAFRLERCGIADDDHVVLIAEEKNAMRVVALTSALRLLGVRRGMTATEARSIVPDLHTDVVDPAAEAEDRESLRVAMETLSDRVVFDPGHFGEEGVLEVSGSAATHGGELATLAKARALFERLGHRVSLALADDPLAAAALARCSVEGVVPVGESATWLASLPVAALGPSLLLAQALAALGLNTVGAFARLERASVSGRYGSEGDRLHRAASGAVAVAATVNWQPDAPIPSVEAVLGGATTTLEIRFVLPGLLRGLAARLAERDMAVVRLRLTLRTERGIPVVVDARFGRPTLDVRVLERVLAERLDGLRLSSPVEAMRLEAADVAPERGWQPGLTDRTEATEPLPDLLARLTDRLGEGALFAAAPANSWRPESAWQRLGWPLPTLGTPEGPDDDDPVAVLSAREIEAPRPRPTVLLPAPTPLAVEVNELGVPGRVQLDGRWFSVAVANGPERLVGEWWTASGGFDRDYWVVRIGDRAAWLFHEADSWNLHGWFD